MAALRAVCFVRAIGKYYSWSVDIHLLFIVLLQSPTAYGELVRVYVNESNFQFSANFVAAVAVDIVLVAVADRQVPA